MQKAWLLSLWAVFVYAAAGSAENFEVILSDVPPAAEAMGLPVAIPLDLTQFPESLRSGNCIALQPSAGGQSSGLAIVQFDAGSPDSKSGTGWCFLDTSGGTEHPFRAVHCPPDPGLWRFEKDEAAQTIEIWEGQQRVLRYNHGAVPVREGTHAHFAEGESYQRGDYIHPLWGPHGEELTEDYPRDHPHHRGVWWSWPVTRWKDQLADIWAVVGVWARPERITRLETGPVFTLLEAENTWKFGEEETPITREMVLIRAFRQWRNQRVIDVEIRLQALTDGVSIGGRPQAGYGGFALRAAPCTDRRIVCFRGPNDELPRRAWIDYAGQFAGGQGISGVAIFEHVTNPDYPNPLHEYPQCNCVMPAYPDKREVPLAKDKALVLKHRLWVHPGTPDEATLAQVWAVYANTPRVRLLD
jgi:hypothetical protein